MEPRLSLITLGVADLERSLRFYRDGLGLPTTWTADKGVVFLTTRGTAISLYPLAHLARDLGPEYEAAAAQPARFSGITLAHNVREKTDVDRILAQAESAGARVIKAGHDVFWGGYVAYFADPDGHLWEIAWGAFPFNDDGSLAIP